MPHGRRHRRTWYIWHLKRIDPEKNHKFDEVSGFVVIAETEDRAREICMEEGADEVEKVTDFWHNRQCSECQKIGISWKKVERMVLRDTNNS